MKIKVLVAVIIIIIGMVFLFQGKEKVSLENKVMEQETQVIEKEIITEDAVQETQMVSNAGVYEVYTESKIASAQTEKIVLFFKASWCPSCIALNSDIKSNEAKIPSNLTILDVDYDTFTDLKKKYGVTTQHTLVQVDRTGQLISKWSGGSTLSSIVSKLK